MSTICLRDRNKTKCERRMTVRWLQQSTGDEFGEGSVPAEQGSSLLVVAKLSGGLVKTGCQPLAPEFLTQQLCSGA